MAWCVADRLPLLHLTTHATTTNKQTNKQTNNKQPKTKQGGFERLHYLLEGAFDADGALTPSFLKAVESWLPWDANPLYALLHEPIYCQGEGPDAAPRWAAVCMAVSCLPTAY